MKSDPTGSVLVVEWRSLFQIRGLTTSIDLPSRVAGRADDLTRDPLVADLSPRLAEIHMCSADERQVWRCMT